MKKKAVLVIEDHESVRKLIGRFLSKTFQVTVKPDALSALAWMSKGQLPDLIVLDISMPKMSSLDFLSNLRSSGVLKNIPVIVVSAEDRDRLIDKCKRFQVQECLSKPFNPIELQQIIENTLDGQHQLGALASR